MKKFGILVLFLVITPIIAGLYGIAHDQITYTISHEYFTKFKFYQFGLMDQGREAIFSNPRIQVSVVGFMATWWLGIPIGLLLGLEGLRYKKAKDMFRSTLKAILITIAVAILGGFIGAAYGYIFLINKPLEEFSTWYIPDNIIDTKHYIEVGAIHNFSYISGIIGLFVALIYSSIKRKKTK